MEPLKLTRKQIAIGVTLLLVLIIGGCWVASAAEPAEPCPPGCQPTPAAVAKPTAPKTKPVAKKPAPQHWRYAFGGDLGYDETHKALAGLHFGMLAPRDARGGNVFWKIGPTVQSRNDWTATCMIGCRSCAATAQAPGPWGALTSVSYIWP